MNDDDWDAGFARSVGLFLNGEAITGRDPRGQRITDDSFLLLFNAHHEPIDWTLPKHWGDQWDLILDTADDSRTTEPLDSGTPTTIAAHSVVVFRRAVPDLTDH
jgi:isoamylase